MTDPLARLLGGLPAKSNRPSVEEVLSWLPPKTTAPLIPSFVACRQTGGGSLFFLTCAKRDKKGTRVKNVYMASTQQKGHYSKMKENENGNN